MVPVVPLRKTFGSVARYSIFRFLVGERLNPLRVLIPKAFRAGIRRCLERRFSPDVRFVRTADWTNFASSDNSLQGAPCPAREMPSLRLNVYGYFSRWFGLGECARLHARVMLAAGWPVALHDVDINIPHSRRDSTLSAYLKRQEDATCSLVFINPDHWEEALRCIAREKEHGALEGSRHYVIGYWFWELEKFPEAWLAALEQVDEIMVSSAFVEHAVRRVSNKPVTRIPLPLLIESASALKRHHFGLPESDTIFFCSFDFNSSIARKNPYAVIEAFRQAFPRGDEKVFLLIKSSNGYKKRALLSALMDAAAFDGRILLRDDMLERNHLQALHQCIDVHVSMHRSEGFGLGLAEAMNLGKPVIATAYSGNQEFMTASNSCPVKFRMVPVLDGQYPHCQGQHWADPDPADAARWMCLLHSDRAFAARVGAQAASDMARDFSADACTAALSRRLEVIAFERRASAPVASCHESSSAVNPAFSPSVEAKEMS